MKNAEYYLSPILILDLGNHITRPLDLFSIFNKEDNFDKYIEMIALEAV
jgi:hypothetical protein